MRKRYLSHQEIKEIGERYSNGESITQIAKITNRSDPTVLDTLRKLGIHDPSRGRKRDQRVNPSIFDMIDSEEKAYWLGFLYADGSHAEQRRQISLHLAAQDLDHMEKYAAFLECTKDISFLPRLTPNSQDSYYLQFSSKQMSASLSRLGLMRNKTIYCRFPTSDQVSPSLIRHFIRGYFDGDGTIRMAMARKPKTKGASTRPMFGISFIGTLDLITGIAKVIESQTGIKSPLSKAKCNQENIRIITFGGNFQTQQFLDWLYSNATIWMSRKHKRYCLLKEINSVKRLAGEPDPFTNFRLNEQSYRYA